MYASPGPPSNIAITDDVVGFIQHSTVTFPPAVITFEPPTFRYSCPSKLAAYVPPAIPVLTVLKDTLPSIDIAFDCHCVPSLKNDGPDNIDVVEVVTSPIFVIVRPYDELSIISLFCSVNNCVFVPVIAFEGFPFTLANWVLVKIVVGTVKLLV